MCSLKADAIALRQHQDFDKLDSSVKLLIQNIAEGETQVNDLLRGQHTAILAAQEKGLLRAASEINDHTTNALRDHTSSITGHVISNTGRLDTTLGQLSTDNSAMHATTLQAVAEMDGRLVLAEEVAMLDSRIERLVKSLKYPSMNERRNRIQDPQGNTFRWIFPTDDNQESDSGNESDWPPYCNSEIFDDETESDDSDALPDSTSTHSVRQKGAQRFREWLGEPNSDDLFWISGKPGSGKSTLMKFLASHRTTLDTLKLCQPPEITSRPTVISHFIWSAGHPIEAQIKGLLCSLAFQLLENDKLFGQAVLERFPATRSKDSHSDWSEKDIKKIFISSLERPPSQVCIFIDGLDEIDPSDGQIPLLDFVEELRKIPRVKLCVSSRPEPILQDCLVQYPSFRMSDMTFWDIRKFASTSLENSFRGASDQDRHELIYEICGTADGVFLWVALAINNLKRGIAKGDGIKDLHERLRALPKDLVDLFCHMWRRLGDDEPIYRKEAARIFNAFLASLRASDDVHIYLDSSSLVNILLATDAKLTSRIIEMGPMSTVSKQELHSHLQEMGRLVETRCAGLLEIDPDELAVNFVHRSAKEFLMNHEEGKQLLYYDNSTLDAQKLAMVNAMIARYCLSSPFNDAAPLGTNHHSGAAAHLILAGLIISLWRKDYLPHHILRNLASNFDNLIPSTRFEDYTHQAIEIRCIHLDFFGCLAHQGGTPSTKLLLDFLENYGTLTGAYVSYLLISSEATRRIPAWARTMERFQDADPSFQSFPCVCDFSLGHDTEERFLLKPASVMPYTPVLALLSRIFWMQNYSIVQEMPIDTFAQWFRNLAILLRDHSADRALSYPVVLSFKGESMPSDDALVHCELLRTLHQHRADILLSSLWVETDVRSVLDLLWRWFSFAAAGWGFRVPDLPTWQDLRLGPTSHFHVSSIIYRPPFKPWEEETKFWMTQEQDTLLRVEDWLKEPLPVQLGRPIYRLSHHGFNEIVREVQQDQWRTTFEAVEQELIDRDVIWRYNDPRGRPPKRYTDL